LALVRSEIANAYPLVVERLITRLRSEIREHPKRMKRASKLALLAEYKALMAARPGKKKTDERQDVLDFLAAHYSRNGKRVQSRGIESRIRRAHKSPK